MSAADPYSQFLRRKLSVVPRTGIAGEISADGSLFDHQRALTNWALRRGSALLGTEMYANTDSDIISGWAYAQADSMIRAREAGQ